MWHGSDIYEHLFQLRGFLVLVMLVNIQSKTFCLLVSCLKTKKIRILPVVLYGCQALLPTLMEGLRLRVFENRVLRRLFRTKRDEVTRGWRKLHNEELHDV
jgi:hypothetical protein